MVEVEQDNIRAALDWSLTRGRDVALGGDLASSLVRFWRAQPREGRRWLEVAQQRIDPARDPKLAAAVTGALTVVAPRGPERRRLLELAVQRYRAVDDTAGLLQTLRQFADELSFSKHLDEAESVLSEALDLSREQSDKESEARCVSLLATVYAHRGDIEQARRLYGQAIDLHVPFETSAVRAHANMLGNLAELEFAAGEPERAIELAMRSIRLELDHDAQSTELALSHCNLAAYLIGVNRFDEAKAHALDALARLRDEQEPYYLVIALEHLAVIAGLSGDVERAVRLASYTNERLHIMGIERELSERLGYERLLVVLSNRYDGNTLRRLMEGGASLTDGDAFGIAEK